MKLDTTFKNRPLSWSQISSFQYDREQWYQSYVLGIRVESNPAMDTGSRIGKAIADGTSLIPGPQYEIYEHPLHFKIGKINCIGFCDGWSHSSLTLGEYKTSANKNRWTQKSVDEHKQLTMYAVGLYLQDKINPKDLNIVLSYIPVEEQGDFSIEWTGEKPINYPTKRTMRQCLEFINEVKSVIKEMKKYTESYPQ